MEKMKSMCVEDLFRMISQNRTFIRFLKEHHAFKAYDRLIRMPKFRGYHNQTIRYYLNHFTNGKYFIVRAFPWNDKDVQNTKICWGILSNEWINLTNRFVDYDAHRQCVKPHATRCRIHEVP